MRLLSCFLAPGSRPRGDGRPRRVAGSVIHDAEIAVARAVRLVRDREVVATDGSTLALEIDTLCLHGDTAGAATGA